MTLWYERLNEINTYDWYEIYVLLVFFNSSLLINTNRKYMKNNSTTLTFCTANCCSWFYHSPVWYSYKFLCNFRRELVCRALQPMIHCSELGERKWDATRWVTADSSWRTWLLPGADRGWAGWWQYANFSPHKITERKRRTASYSWSG